MTEFLFEPQDDVEEWRAKLVGKTLVAGEESAQSSEQQFPKSSLPPGNRVVTPGMPMTRDYLPGRLNVFVDDNNQVTQVYYA
ncbi:hypothetical protein VTP01DRAFT_3797 [Rhizomucor pusillus]|uniref:uncharacterized protein n=1 Tax=Rhizomucor pusillus TaxID=4840 RepID=UPI003743268F